MRSLYTFTAYSPEWPRQFEQEAERLRALLGDELVIAHHIGSSRDSRGRSLVFSVKELDTFTGA